MSMTLANSVSFDSRARDLGHNPISRGSIASGRAALQIHGELRQQQPPQ
jgi:hypothetical protein